MNRLLNILTQHCYILRKISLAQRDLSWCLGKHLKCTNKINDDHRKQVNVPFTISYIVNPKSTSHGLACQTKYACFKASNKICTGQQCTEFIFYSVLKQRKAMKPVKFCAICLYKETSYNNKLNKPTETMESKAHSPNCDLQSIHGRCILLGLSCIWRESLQSSPRSHSSPLLPWCVLNLILYTDNSFSDKV